MDGGDVDSNAELSRTILAWISIEERDGDDQGVDDRRRRDAEQVALAKEAQKMAGRQAAALIA